jgi:molecular chaperone DnaJ
VLRLRGKGLPEFGGRKRGDLYIRVDVHIPEKLGVEERKLWERLRATAKKEKRESV